MNSRFLQRFRISISSLLILIAYFAVVLALIRFLGWQVILLYYGHWLILLMLFFPVASIASRLRLLPWRYHKAFDNHAICCMLLVVAYASASGPLIAYTSKRISVNGFSSPVAWRDARACGLVFAPLARSLNLCPAFVNHFWMDYVDFWMPGDAVVVNTEVFGWGYMEPGSPPRPDLVTILSYADERLR